MVLDINADYTVQREVPIFTHTHTHTPSSIGEKQRKRMRMNEFINSALPPKWHMECHPHTSYPVYGIYGQD